MINPWVYLEIEKRKRLLQKGVLPTTVSGVYTGDEAGGFVSNKKTNSMFPHLFTPIKQPFRRHHCFFGVFQHMEDGGDRIHHGPERVNRALDYAFSMNEVKRTDEAGIIVSPQYGKARDAFDQNEHKYGYSFFRIDKSIYYVRCIKTLENTYTLHKMRIGDPSKTPDLYQIILDALKLYDETNTTFYTPREMVVDGGIFTKAFNASLIEATYAAAAYSLLEKMKDNLEQLFCARPYYLGCALLAGEIPTCLYHLLGVFHAFASLVLDPLVEIIALVTRTLLTSHPDKPEELFYTEGIIPPILPKDNMSMR